METSRSSEPVSAFAGFLLLILLSLLPLYGPIVWGNSTLFFRDVLHNYYPLISFLKQSLLQGDLPLWNPYLFTGTPQAAALEPPLFYPLAWMFFVLPYKYALALNLCLHHLLAAGGIYLLGRNYGWAWPTRTLTAMGLTLGGVMVAMNNVHPLQNSAALIPLLFWACDRLCRERRLEPALVFAILYALQILSGHLEIVYFTSVFIGFYICLHIDAKALRLIGLMTLAVVLGLGLSAVQLLPSLSFSTDSVRQGGLDIANASQWSYHPLLTLLLLLPDMRGSVYEGLSLNMVFGDPKFGQALLFVSAYIGLLSCLGFVMAIPELKRHPERRVLLFWLLVSLFSLLLAFGQHLPIYEWVLKIPGMSFFRYPSKFLILSVLGIAIFSGFGLNRIWDGASGSRRLLQFTGAWLALLGLSCLGVWLGRTALANLLSELIVGIGVLKPAGAPFWSADFISRLLEQGLRQILLCAALLALWWLCQRQQLSQRLRMGALITLTGFDLLSSSVNAVWLTSDEILTVQSPVSDFFKERGLDRKPQERFIVAYDIKALPDSFRPDLKRHGFLRGNLFKAISQEENYGLLHGFRSAYGFLPGRTYLSNLYYQLYDKVLEDGQLTLRSHLESASAVRYLISINPEQKIQALYQNNPLYRQQAFFPEINTYIHENLSWQPRVRFLTQAFNIKDEKMTRYIFANPKETGYSPQKHVVLLEDKALIEAKRLIPPQEAAQKQWSEPQILTESNNRIEISFKTNTSGYLVLADQYAAGWQAVDNGQQLPILRANFMNRAVRLGPGDHHLIFSYTPPGWQAGLLTTATTVFLWLGLWLWSRRKPQLAAIPAN
ncbi:MAG: hypothetical protein CVV27_09620 [Candidatus Melainabacteria bacterium HGW-Melainabacteria-1]|nr:MAG: hypothetical protein CVV27_09620 [Candidatus Melainabacteria bacterium HGW-Melainabacteria-1]